MFAIALIYLSLTELDGLFLETVLPQRILDRVARRA